MEGVWEDRVTMVGNPGDGRVCGTSKRIYSDGNRQLLYQLSRAVQTKH